MASGGGQEPAPCQVGGEGGEEEELRPGLKGERGGPPRTQTTSFEAPSDGHPTTIRLPGRPEAWMAHGRQGGVQGGRGVVLPRDLQVGPGIRRERGGVKMIPPGVMQN